MNTFHYHCSKNMDYKQEMKETCRNSTYTRKISPGFHKGVAKQDGFDVR